MARYHDTVIDDVDVGAPPYDADGASALLRDDNRCLSENITFIRYVMSDMMMCYGTAVIATAVVVIREERNDVQAPF